MNNMQDIFDTANPHSFVRHSEQSRAKTKAALTGRKKSAEHRQHIAQALKGLPKSQEHTEKNKAAHRTPQYREQASQRLLGRKPTWSMIKIQTPWGQFDSKIAFIRWAKQHGLPDPRKHLKRALLEFPDQFYIEKHKS